MDGNSKGFENLDLNERIGRFIVSFVVVVSGLQAPWVGSDMFAVVNIVAVLLILTAIIGWDPVRAMSMNKARKFGAYFPHKTDKHHWPK